MRFKFVTTAAAYVDSLRLPSKWPLQCLRGMKSAQIPYLADGKTEVTDDT